MSREKTTKNKEVPEVETNSQEVSLEKREQALKEREDAVERREKGVQVDEEDLHKRKQEFDEQINSDSRKLDEREETLNQKEAELQEREARIEARENALQEHIGVDVVEPSKGHEFEFEGEKYKFRDDAPKTLLFNGKSISQEDIAKDEDFVLQLIGGNLGLIEKI